LEAVKKGFRRNESLRVNIADITNHISKIIVKLSSLTSKKIFVNKHGVEIGKFQRRAVKNIVMSLIIIPS
jgi:hypothetical protein